jgi:hypothetical protein
MRLQRCCQETLLKMKLSYRFIPNKKNTHCKKNTHSKIEQFARAKNHKNLLIGLFLVWSESKKHQSCNATMAVDMKSQLGGRAPVMTSDQNVNGLRSTSLPSSKDARKHFDRFENKTCAILFNSGALWLSRAGSAIDSHGAVIRINVRPPVPAEIIGGRTDMQVLWWKQYNDVDANASNVTYVSFANPANIEHFDAAHKLYMSKSRANNFFLARSEFFHGASSLLCNAKVPSSGLLAVVFAVSVCREVHVFGFGDVDELPACVPYSSAGMRPFELADIEQRIADGGIERLACQYALGISSAHDFAHEHALLNAWAAARVLHVHRAPVTDIMPCERVDVRASGAWHARTCVGILRVPADVTLTLTALCVVVGHLILNG